MLCSTSLAWGVPFKLYLAGVYTLLVVPQLFSLATTFPTQKFLQAQTKVSVLTWIASLILVLHVILCWLFVNVFDWAASGAVVAYDLSHLTCWAGAVAQFVYMVGWCKDRWKGFLWASFTEIWAFVRLSLASAIMLCLEIWYFMSIIILTGHLSNAVTAVGALSICMNVNGWEAMLFIGINAAISEDMKRAVAHLAGLLAITMVLNSVQPVISGVAVGGGWQALVAYINLACYYIFCLPLGYVLGYMANMGVKGLWVGMIAGTVLQTLLLLLVLYKTNWKKEVEQTCNACGSGEGKTF